MTSVLHYYSINKTDLLPCDITHQFDLSIAHNGAELAQIPHQTVEDVSDAFPLLTAHFLHTGQLCLKLHKTGLLQRKDRITSIITTFYQKELENA